MTQISTDKIFAFKEETHQILGAAFEVYNQKGCGFLEPVYQECLALEFQMQNIPFRAQTPIHLDYKGMALQQRYCADFICFDKILVEIKAVSQFADEHRAQIINYLNATQMPVGLLINFGHYPKVEYQRFAGKNLCLSV